MMRFRQHHFKINFSRFIIIVFFFPAGLLAGTKTWTGLGGDANWLNPLNWSAAALPLANDDVLLDNGDLPGSYQVILPDLAVILRTLVIKPSPGRNIELILPASNKITDAFTVTGPGYGLELNAGAIFRNASGLASGESMHIADSFIIHDGGRYVHQTRAAHANSILKFLSTAPGTEQGVFDFDVPKASYTVSVSNRIYGSLELHSTALGTNVNYTCTGANPLLVRGNLRIGANVSMSMNLSGDNGNIQIGGDFIQEGGQLNLASAVGDHTVLRIKGGLHQAPSGTITETADGSAFIELNGDRIQEIDMAGRILREVGFRMNSSIGSVLSQPLTLPWVLEFEEGRIISSKEAMLIIDTGCRIIIDSARLTGGCVEGPMRKLGLNHEGHFLFPVGKDGILRWLELKDASGNYTVEYFHENPNRVGNRLGAGLDHISKLEYWTVTADADMSDQAKIELSFSSSQSGGVTDPNYLNVAKYQTDQWEDAGHSGITGNFIQGSVLSNNTDFEAVDYTLASVLNFENPLPLTSIELEVKEISGKAVFNWTLQSPETADHFDLFEMYEGHAIRIAQVKAHDSSTNYRWVSGDALAIGEHFFRISMTDVHGNQYVGKLVLFKKTAGNATLSWLYTWIPGGTNQLMIRSEGPDLWEYAVINMNGRAVTTGNLDLKEGYNYFTFRLETMPAGFYIFSAWDRLGRYYSLLFEKN